MANFRPIKKLRMGLERQKDEKTGKERQKRITNPKKDRKEWKDPFQEREKKKKIGRRKIFFKQERAFFRSCSNTFSPAYISSVDVKTTI